MAKTREEMAEVSCSLAESDLADQPIVGLPAITGLTGAFEYNLFGGGLVPDFLPTSSILILT